VTCIIKLGPTASEIVLSDTSRYIFPPDGFHKEYLKREIFRERRSGGSDLAYSRIMAVQMSAQLDFVPDPVDGYDAALARLIALRRMLEDARQYWRHLKDSPNPWPPVYYTEQFLNQGSLSPVTRYLVQTGDEVEGARVWLPSGGIRSNFEIRCDAPEEENDLT